MKEWKIFKKWDKKLIKLIKNKGFDDIS
jgi:hypothetical protein